jgi:foldase protein PrsA
LFYKTKEGVYELKKILSIIVASVLAISMSACTKKSPVATVNGVDITLEKYQDTLNAYKVTFENMYGKDVWNQQVEGDKTRGDEFKEDILNRMIQDELVYQKAEDKKLVPSDEEVNKQYDEFKKSIGDNGEYIKKLKDTGIDEAFLKDQMKKDVAIQNYSAEYIANLKISNDDLNKYYNDKKEEFRKEEVKASHILISTQDAEGKPLSDKDKANKKKEAEDILAKIKAGEDFGELAKKYSNDPGSAKNGGDLGFFAKGVMVAEFENTAFSLEKGKVSDLVESEFGYHIIKVTDKVNQIKPFAEVKGEIKEKIEQEKYNAHIKEIQKNAKIQKNEDVIKNVKL